MVLEIFNFDMLTQHVLASIPDTTDISDTGIADTGIADTDILVLGLGDRTDIYSAYGVAKRLNQSLVEINKNKHVNITYGNIKEGHGPNKYIDKHISYNEIEKYLYNIVKTNQLLNDIPNVRDNDIVFESSIPINAFKATSPLLFYLNDDSVENIGHFLDNKFDVIITVNNGGGKYIHTKNINDINLDSSYSKIYHIMRILDVLKKERGKTIIQLFIAPAIDDVLSVETMKDYLNRKYKPEFYLGSFFFKKCI